MLAEGVIHVEQPRETIAAIGAHLAQRTEPLRLSALHLMTNLTGSALLALAVDFGELDVEAAWNAAHVDEDWQIEPVGAGRRGNGAARQPQARHAGGSGDTGRYRITGTLQANASNRAGKPARSSVSGTFQPREWPPHGTSCR